MIKATRIEIKRLEDRERDSLRKAAWKDLAVECLEATNCFWETWLQWHLANRSREQLRAWLEEVKVWHDLPKEKRGKKPKYPVSAMPPACSQAVYKKVCEACPSLHTRTVCLITKRLTETMKSRKAAHGSLSWWSCVLLHRERMPGSIDPQPIPFNRRNSTLVIPDKGQENWRFEFRVERIGFGKSLSDTVELVICGRKRKYARDILSRIAAGTYEMKGSVLAFERGKWFLLLTYSMPDMVKPELEEAKKAVFLPGRRDPWNLLMGGSLRYEGGTGRHIAAIRKRCVLERLERQENYRWAGSSQRGHGRDRATASWTRLRNIWTHACTNYNRHVAKAIVSKCVSQGCGTLEYWQPFGRHAETRFLATCGKQDERRESTSYPFYQMATRLAQLCAEQGIAFKVVKVGNETEAAVA